MAAKGIHCARIVAILTAGLIVLAQLPAATAAPRVWTDLQGRQINAEFVRLVGNDVVLKQPNGRVARVPLATLSDADKEFIRIHLAEQGFRIWTATDGRQIEAQYLRVRDGAVYVKFQGSTTSFPFDRLSIADRMFVREAAAKDDQADQLPEPSDDETLPEARLWTDRGGESAIAQFDRILPDGRVLLAADNATRVVHVAELSDEDHGYLQEVLEPKGLADLVPAKPEPEPEPEPPPVEPEPEPELPIEPTPPTEPPSPEIRPRLPFDPAPQQPETPYVAPQNQPAPSPNRSSPAPTSGSGSGSGLSIDNGVVRVMASIASLMGIVGSWWIAAIAFQRGSPVFGFLSMLCCCPAAVIFGLTNSDECAIPLGLILIGVVGDVVWNVMVFQAIHSL